MRLPLHGLSSRQDLPLPFEFVLLGAALAIVLSFAVLAFAWRRPRYTQPRGYALPRLTRVVDSRACRLILRLFLLGLYGWMALALWFGQDRVTNPIFGFVFVWLWVGVVPLSLLLGPVWQRANPLRTIAQLAPQRRGPIRPLTGAAWSHLGLLPGLVTIVAFAWLELRPAG